MAETSPLYVVLPTLMIPLSLMLPRRVNRTATIVVAVLFLVTIVGSAIGEMGYYVLGSAVEAALLIIVMVLAVRWRP